MADDDVIKDFLDEPETGGVASDRDFMDYVFNRRPEHPDYERVRFSLNYRMLKEKKDFEFVGTDLQELGGGAGPGAFSSPFKVAFGPSGLVYISDVWNNRVIELQQ